MLLFYQLASTAVIVAGNTLFCKKTYRFGLFISLALTLVASIHMESGLSTATLLKNQAWPYLAALLLQFASSTPAPTPT
jgi:hypothetical protein